MGHEYAKGLKEERFLSLNDIQKGMGYRHGVLST